MPGDMPNVSEAVVNQWYETFAQGLQQRGIPLNDPIILGKVRVIPPMEALEPSKFFGKGIPLDDSIDKVINCAPAAFLPRDEDGDPVKTFDGEDYVNYLAANIKTPPTQEHKNWLFAMALQGRLFIENEDPSLDLVAGTCVLAREDGTCLFTPADTFFDYVNAKDEYDTAQRQFDSKRITEQQKNEAQAQAQQKINAFLMSHPYTEAEIERYNAHTVAYSGLIEQMNIGMSNYGSACLRQLDRVKDDPERAKTLTNNVRSFVYSSEAWYRATPFVTQFVKEHPDLIRTKQDRKLLNDLARVASIPQKDTTLRDPARDAVAKDYMLGGPRTKFEKLPTRLLKKTGCKTIAEMMERDVLMDPLGKPLAKDNAFKYYLTFHGDLNVGKELNVLEPVNGVPTRVPYRANPDGSLQRTQNTRAYAQQLRDIKRQFDKLKLPAAQGDLGTLLAGVADEVGKLPSEVQESDRLCLETRLASVSAGIKVMRRNLLARADETHKLNDKQLQQLKLMNRTDNLLFSSRMAIYQPQDNYRIKLAEKLCAAYAVQQYKSNDHAAYERGLRLLSDPAAHFDYVMKLAESDTLTQLIGDKTTAQQDKLLRRDNTKVLREFTKLGSLPAVEDARPEAPDFMKQEPVTAADLHRQMGWILNRLSTTPGNMNVFSATNAARQMYRDTLELSLTDPHGEVLHYKLHNYAEDLRDLQTRCARCGLTENGPLAVMGQYLQAVQSRLGKMAADMRSNVLDDLPQEQPAPNAQPVNEAKPLKKYEQLEKDVGEAVADLLTERVIVPQLQQHGNAAADPARYRKGLMASQAFKDTVTFTISHQNLLDPLLDKTRPAEERSRALEGILSEFYTARRLEMQNRPARNAPQQGAPQQGAPKQNDKPQPPQKKGLVLNNGH